MIWPEGETLAVRGRLLYYIRESSATLSLFSSAGASARGGTANARLNPEDLEVILLLFDPVSVSFSTAVALASAAERLP